MHKVLLSAAIAVGAVSLFTGSASASNAVSTSTNTHKPIAVLTSAPPAQKSYVVQEGDTLTSIAQNENLDSWRPLWNANQQISDPNLIDTGWTLTVPTGSTTERPLPADTTSIPAQTYAPAGGQVYQNVQPTQYEASANYAAGAGGVLAAIRRGESGGNYAEDTGNGYYGAYQFDLQTWESVGGTGLPSEASPAEQDAMAQKLYDERGCSPWPNTCP